MNIETGTAVPESPFHAAERAVQRRAGVDPRIDEIGRRAIRDHLLQQHQEFYQTQHQLLLGLVDARGRPWVGMVVGAPGFAHALSPTRLRIDARPLVAVPQARALSVGTQVGVLGIDYATRRRNRVNGRIARVDDAGFELAVVHSFGNCPKYIQRRELTQAADARAPSTPATAHALPRLDAAMRALIHGADHFYIATHYDPPGDEAHHGADVSHRGGKPGFVRIEDDGTLLFPDFAGNRFYNTLGNITANGRAGLLFIDFDSGSVLSMSGEAAVDWGDPGQPGFAGAERLVRFAPRERWIYRDALPLRWRFVEQSPALDRTGRWA